MLEIWSLVPLPFLKPAWTSGSSWFRYCWSLAWRILSITLLACEMSAMCGNLSILWHCFSLVAQRLNRLPAMRETRVLSLSWEYPLEKEMATHSSTLAWKIPWMEEPGRLQSTGSQRVGHDWVTSLSTFTFFEIEMKTDLFQDCGHCWVFQMCWHIECSTFTASSSRICKSSTGIPSLHLLCL